MHLKPLAAAAAAARLAGLSGFWDCGETWQKPREHALQSRSPAAREAGQGGQQANFPTFLSTGQMSYSSPFATEPRFCDILGPNGRSGA